MRDDIRRDPCELEPLEPRLLLSGDPIVVAGPVGDLMGFISGKLNDFVTANNTVGAKFVETFVLQDDEVDLGGIFTIEEPTLIFDVEVVSLTPTFTGTVSITAGAVSADFGTAASLEITDGIDGDDHALIGVFTLTSQQINDGTFSLGLDQVELTVAEGVIVATAVNLVFSYSPSGGFTTEGFSFPTIKANLATGPPGAGTTVLEADGSGLILFTETGVAAEIDLSLTTGPDFASQHFALSGDLTLRLNTTGEPVSSIGGESVDLPSEGGAVYVQVVVSGATLVIGDGNGSGALTADKLVFEKSGTVVTLSAEGLAFVLKAGSDQVLKASSDAIVMQFVDDGFVAFVEGATVQGPILAGESLALTGKVDLAVNTTGSSANLPGVLDPVPGISADTYLKATVRGLTEGAEATLSIAGSVLSAVELVFERNDSGFAFSGTGLSIELRAGTKRIAGVSGASFAFQFIQGGFYGGLVNAAIQGPDFMDGGSPLFALAGVVSLRINTTQDPRTININGEDEVLPGGSPGSPAIRVELTGDPPDTAQASLTVLGSSLTADKLVFEQKDGEVSVGGLNVGLTLNAGTTRIVGVSGADFEFVFVEEGFFGALRNGAIEGPEISGFTFTGVAGLAINTTGLAKEVTLGEGLEEETISLPAGSGSYVAVTFEDLVIAIDGFATLQGNILFQKDGNEVLAAGTNVSARIAVSSSLYVEITGADFGLIAGETQLGLEVKGGSFGAALGPLGSFDAEEVFVQYTNAATTVQEGRTISFGGVMYTFDEEIAPDTAAFSVTGFSAELLGFVTLEGNVGFQRVGTEILATGEGVGARLEAGPAYVGLDGADFGLIAGEGKLAFELKNGTFGAAIAGLANVDASTVLIQYTNAGTTVAENRTISAGGIDYTFVAGIEADTTAFATTGFAADVAGFVSLSGNFAFQKTGNLITVAADSATARLEAGPVFLQLAGAKFGFFAGDGELAFELKDGTFTASIDGLAELEADTVLIQYTNASTTVAKDQQISVGTVTYTFDEAIAEDTVAFALTGFSADILGFVSLEGDIGFRMSGQEIIAAGVVSASLEAGSAASVSLSDAHFGLVAGDGQFAFEMKNGDFDASLAGIAGVSATGVFIRYSNATTTVEAGRTVAVGAVSYQFVQGIAADTLAFAGQVSFHVGDFFYVDAFIFFDQTQLTVTLSDETTAQVDAVLFGAVNVEAFAGFNGNSQDRVGFALEGVDFALLTMTDSTGRSWTALQAGAESIGFVGIDDLTIEGSASIGINLEASDGTLVDFSASSVTLPIEGLPGGITFDLPHSTETLVVIEGELTVNIFDFVEFDVDIQIEQTFPTLSVRDEFGNVSSVPVATLSFSHTGLDYFAGVNGVGFNVENASFGFLLAVDLSDPSNFWIAAVASADTVEFSGADILEVSTTNLDLFINLADSQGRALDFSNDPYTIRPGLGASGPGLPEPAEDDGIALTMSGAGMGISGDLTIDLFGFLVIDGSFFFEVGTETVTLSDGSSVVVDALRFAGEDVDAFAGMGQGTEAEFGLKIEGLTLGLGVFTHKTDSSLQWVAVQGSADSIGLVGLPDVVLEASNIDFALNTSAGGEVIDFKQMEADGNPLTFGHLDFTFDLDGSLGALLQFSATFEVDFFGLVEFEDFIAIDLRLVPLIAYDPNTDSLVEVDVVFFSLAFTELDLFFGVNEGTESEVGLAIEDLSFGAAVIFSPASGSVWVTIQGETEYAGLVGIDGFALEFDSIRLAVNTPDSNGRTLHYDEETGGRNLVLSTGAGSSILSVGENGDTFTIDLDGTTGQAVVVELLGALLSIDGFLHISGNLVFALGLDVELKVSNATALPGTVTRDFNTITIGASEVNVFVGFNGPYFGEGDEGDATGLYVRNAAFGLAFFVQSSGSEGIKLTALHLDVEEAGLAGFGDVLSVSLSGISVSFNGGAEKTKLFKPYIDFQDNFGENGYEVQTGGESIFFTFDSPFIGARVEQAHIQISEFLLLEGSLAFTKGTRVDDVTPNLGLLEDFGISGITHDIEIMTIGGANLNGFAGTGAVYTEFGDLVLDNAIGVTVQDVHFGIAVMTPIGIAGFDLGIQGLESVLPKYLAVKATVGSAAIIGMDGILEVLVEGVEVNINTGIIPGLPAPLQLLPMPHIDLVAVFGQAGLEIDTGDDENPVFLDFENEIIQAKIEYLEGNLADIVQLSGSMAFTKRGGEEVTLTDGTTRTVTSISIGISQVYAFVGYGGYWQDSDNDGRITGDDEPNLDAYGIAIEGLSVGLVIFLETNPVDPAIYFAAQADLTAAGLVGIDGVTLEATDFSLSLNQAVSGSAAVIDFSAYAEGHYAIETGDPENPILIDFDERIFRVAGAVELDLFDIITAEGVIEIKLTDQEFTLFIDASASIGVEGFSLETDIMGLIVVREDGVAVRVEVSDFSLELDDVAELTIESIVLVINTTGTVVTYQVPLEFQDRVGKTSIEISNIPPNQTEPTDFYVAFLASGSLNLADGVFVLTGDFSILITDEVVELGINASMVVKAGSTTLLSFTASGFISIRSEGIVGAIELTMSANVPGSFGFTFEISSARLEVNTTGSTVLLPGSLGSVDPGFLVRISGKIKIPGLELSGTFQLKAGNDMLTVALNASVSIFGATLNVSGFAGIYYDANPGFAFSLTLRLGNSENVTVTPFTGFTIGGSFQLAINTTGVERFDPLDSSVSIPAGLRIAVTNLSVNLFGFVLSGTIIIDISAQGLSITIPEADPLTLDFFGFITLSVHGFLHTDGQFSFTASASMKVGDPDIFGFEGNITVSFSNNGFSGSLSGTFGAFGIKVSASGSFSVVDGIVSISVHISLQISPAFSFKVWTPWKTYTVHVPALVISGNWTMVFGGLTTAAAPPPPPNLARVENEILYLNIGVDAHHRGAHYPSDDESYTISLVGPGTSSGQKLQVNALGFDQEYDNVTKIVVVDTQSKNNFIAISGEVTVPVEINLGKTVSGQNRFILAGGTASVQGGTGGDWVEFGTGGGTFIGGASNSKVKDNSGGLVTISAPGFDNYLLTDASLTYSTNGVLDQHGNEVLHVMTFLDKTVKNAVLNGAANAIYEVSSLPDPDDGTLSTWTGNATFNGSGGASVVQATTSGSLTLTDTSLTEAGVTITLSNIGIANLFGNSSANTFDVSGWTKSGSLTGAGGTDTVVAVNNANFTLTDTSLARSSGGTFTLDGIEIAQLTGGAAANTFTVGSWTGSAFLDGAGAGDTYTINLTGAGSGTVTINDTGSSGTDAVTVNGTSGADLFTLTGTQVTLGSATETVGYAGIETLVINGGAGNDTFVINGTSVTTTINGGDGSDQFTVNSSGAALILNGDAGNDTFTVNDNGAALTLNGGAGNDTMTVVNTSTSLEMNGGDGNDIFNIRGLGADAQLNTGSGTNIVNVGSAAPGAGGTLNAIGGKLTINGQGSSDTVNVDDSGDDSAGSGLLTPTRLTGLGMAGGDASKGIEYTGVEALVINLGSGDDALTITGTHAGTTVVNGGAGNDRFNVRATSGALTINGGSGNDSVFVGSNAGQGDTGGNVNAIAGHLTFNGGTGDDRLHVDDTGDTTANTGRLTNTSLTGLGMGSQGITYGGIETLDIHLGSGGDTFEIESTAAGTTTTLETNDGDDQIFIRAIAGPVVVNTGAGNDTITVGRMQAGTTGTLNDIAAALTLDGGTGTDTLLVLDDADTAANTGTLTSSTINGLGLNAAGIDYTAFATLEIRLGSGDDTFRIESTHSGSTTLRAGAGNDTVHVDSTSGATTVQGEAGNDTIIVGTLDASPGLLDAIAGHLTVEGGAGTDTLIVRDDADTEANTGQLHPTTITGLGMGTLGITYSQIADLQIRLGEGDDTFFVHDTHAGTTKLWAGPGDDTVYVLATSGTTTVYGEEGDDTVIAGTHDSSAGILDGIAGHLIVDGGTGTDTLIVRDDADTAPNTGHLHPTTITGLGMGPQGITYTQFADLQIRLGTGGDTFSIHNTHAGTTTLWAGPGSDTVYVLATSGITTVHGEAGDDTIVAGTLGSAAGILDGLAGHLIVTGGPGSDTLLVRDDADLADNSGTLTESTIAGLGMGPEGILYSEIEVLEIRLGAGDDTFHIASTHDNLTTLRAGPGDDQVNISTIAGETRIRGEAGEDTIRVNVTESGAERLEDGRTVNGVGALLDLDGGTGTDTYIIYAASAPHSEDHPVSLIRIHDTGGGGAGTDRLFIYGTDDPEEGDRFLIRRNFIAILPLAGDGEEPTAERIEYDATLNGGIIIYGRAGNDTFIFDDTGTSFTVDGGAGNDVFQFGQMFQSERTSSEITVANDDGSITTYAAPVAPGDEFETYETTLGFLSVGTSHPVTAYGGTGDDTFIVFSNRGPLALYGEDGDDTFLVRAFALKGSQSFDPGRDVTEINGGGDNDYIEYVVGAPVAIDGGTGFNRLVVIGTEFGDRFVITADGIYGAGLYINFVGIQAVEIDGMQGDDTFVILSTARNTSVTIYGGLGSDLFDVGGDAGVVVSNDLRGHSGLISHTVDSADEFFVRAAPGVSVNVADIDSAGVVVTLPDSHITVAESDYGLGLTVASYTVVLTRKPDEDVFITVAAPELSLLDVERGADSVKLSKDGNAADVTRAIELHFTPENWNTPQTVHVHAVDDGAQEGERFLYLQHSVSGDSDGAYLDVVIRNVPVRIIDNDQPGVAFLPPAGGTQVIEGGAAATIYVLLTGAPAAGETVTVHLSGDADIQPSTASIQFDASNWNSAVAVNLTAVNDSRIEGRHIGVLTSTVSSSGGAGAAYASATGPELEVVVYDNDVPMVVITESGGSTDVFEGGDPATQGAPFIDSYTVSLTAAPQQGVPVHVRVRPDPTPVSQNQPRSTWTAQVAVSTNHPGAFYTTETDPETGATLQVLVLVFTAEDWNAPRTVTVTGIADGIAEGSSKVQAFPDNLQVVDGIRGPLHLIGGPNPSGDYTLPDPLLYLGESNPEVFVGDENPNLTFDETLGIDILVIRDNDSVADRTGILTSDHLSGLGMGGPGTIAGVAHDGGIRYTDIEMLDIRLGSGDDRLLVASTHGGSTTIDAGPGDDILHVQSVAGHTTLQGGPGNDTFNLGSAFDDSNWNLPVDFAAAAPQGTINELRGRVTVIGGSGDDVLNIDDSGDSADQVGTLTGDSLSGLDLVEPIVFRIELPHVLAGTFELELNGVSTAPLPIEATPEELRAALLALNQPGVTDVTVNRSDFTLIVTLVADAALDGNLQLEGSAGVTVLAWQVNGLQTLSFDPGATGAHRVSVAGGAAYFFVTPGDSPFAVRNALLDALDTLPEYAGLLVTDVVVAQVGSGYQVAFQGRVAGSFGAPLTLTGDPVSTIASTGAGAATLGLYAVGGTFRLTLGGATTAPLAFDASSAQVAAALNAALGVSGITAVAAAGGHAIDFGALPDAASLSLGIDDRLLVSPIDAVLHTSGIGYYGIEEFNLSTGSGSDVFNVRGTSAVTNLYFQDGDDRIYVSSLAAETQASAPTTLFLEGDLDGLLGPLNLDLGSGRHQLMISAEGALAGVGTSENRARMTGTPVIGYGLPSAEIWLVGIAPAPITFGAAADGNIADGITVWTGWGNDYLLVESTHFRPGLRTTTSLNTGLGNDDLIVNLHEGEDGFFVLNTQGPYTDHLEYPDDDTVDATGSTLPLIIFGGQGDDHITGGSGGDIIFGDRGRVIFTDSNDPAGQPVAVFGSGNDDFTDGVIRPVSILFTVDPTAGGGDVIVAGAGNDIVIGGTGSDWIETAGGNNLIFGDHGRVEGTILPSLLPLAMPEGDKPFTFTSIFTGIDDGGAGDVIFGGAGDDIIIGGQGGDIIFGGAGDDDIIGGHNVPGGADGDDIIDGGPGNNVIAGDNASILRRGDTLSPLIRVLEGTTLYHLPGTPGYDPAYPAAVTDAWQPHPLGVAGRDITLFDHHHDETSGWMFGNDLIAGGPGHDLIFGQLGDDVLHGDGWIEVIFDENRQLVSVTLHPAEDVSTDGDDYIEGGGGDDLIIGGFGQDDLIGGSSSLFGLVDARQRPDGSDMIFGGNAVTLWRYEGRYYWQGNLPEVPAEELELVYLGAGNSIGLNHTGPAADDPGFADRHARDADVILGDNGNIYRIVGINGGAGGAYLEFNYDALDPTRGELRIIPRSFELLDYVPGVGDPSADGIHGGGDILYGEDGDDIIHGMAGNDVIYGGAGDDDIYGGAGHDWISGGAGDDGVLGDDGRIFTSRNSAAYGEPLYGIAPLPASEINKTLSTPGNHHVVIINLAGQLEKRVDLAPFELGGHDIIYGGRGNDFLHGGAGDDAISGAEPLAVSAGVIDGQVFVFVVDDPHGIRANLDDPLLAAHGILDYGRLRPGKFALYDEQDALRKIMIDPATGQLQKNLNDPGALEFLLNFDAFLKDENRQPVLDGSGALILIDHGNDIIFGGHGNDWLVAGTGNNRLFGGLGDDLLNVNNNLDTNGGLNDVPDGPMFGFADLAYGGGGRDVLIANHPDDRLIDWTGEFNVYLVPFSPFGAGAITRQPSPGLIAFLKELAASDGADFNTGAAPFGELGLITQQDEGWQEQTGSPDDPQPGNTTGGGGGGNSGGGNSGGGNSGKK